MFREPRQGEEISSKLNNFVPDATYANVRIQTSGSYLVHEGWWNGVGLPKVFVKQINSIGVVRS